MPPIGVLGCAVPENLLEELKRVDPQPQVQTYLFQWAVIHALASAGCNGLSVFSTLPVRDFPFAKKAIWWGGAYEVSGPRGELTHVRVMPFVSVLVLKQVTRFLSALVCVGVWGWRCRGQSRSVLLLNGLIVSHLYAAIILRKLVGCRVVAIVTDPPTPDQADEGLLYHWARKLDRSLLATALARLDGIIPLAHRLAERFAPRVPQCVVEGMISNEVERHCSAASSRSSPTGTSKARPVVMYAGTLNERLYGVELLLGACDILRNEDIDFWVFGRGRLEGGVCDAARANPRLKYFGLQPMPVVLERMQTADIMVNPRPEVEDVTPYSFPSKLIEYMALGKVVIGARLSGIPADYYPHFVSLPALSAESLASAIRDVLSWPPERRNAIATSAREFVWQTKTQTQQGHRMVRFLRSVASEGAAA